ncbi:hypothetical protein AVEN_63817-1, partial [Araneus ventricosus]
MYRSFQNETNPLPKLWIRINDSESESVIPNPRNQSESNSDSRIRFRGFITNPIPRIHRPRWPSALQVLKTKYGESLQLPQWDVTSGYSHRGNVMLEKGYDGQLRPEEGNISVLFTLYSDLTSIFSSQEAQNESDSSGVLNSAVVSATVSQNRKPRPISRPVRILMEHLLPKPNDTACVFWNMQ